MSPPLGGGMLIAWARRVSERNDALLAFFETVPDAMVAVDESGRVAVANSLTERMFGYPRAELIGRPIELLMPPRSRAVHLRHRADFFRAPTTRPMGVTPMPLSGLRKDGIEFPVEISLSPMRTVGGLLVAAAIRDISARKAAEEELRRSLAEKEILLKEVHHRVKNNLQMVSSLLNLGMDRITDERARGLFQESQARVRAIAAIHERLYESRDLAHVGLADYLGGLARGLFAAYGVDPNDVALSVEIAEIPMGVDAAIACGLIVNELVSNALKHAFPRARKGAVLVALRREGRRATLEVRDDGAGMPEGIDLGSPGTLGLRLVSILAEQLHGTIELERAGGTRVLVRFERGDER